MVQEIPAELMSWTIPLYSSPLYVAVIVAISAPCEPNL
jgi:hypothetical protein